MLAPILGEAARTRSIAVVISGSSFHEGDEWESSCSVNLRIAKDPDAPSSGARLVVRD